MFAAEIIVHGPFLCSVFSLLARSVEAQCVSCPPASEDTYHVHLIPHSHMDLGWLKTVEQYYYGTNAKVTTDAVQYIYDSVLRELPKDESRRFIFVETGFFSLWWKNRPESHEVFMELLQKGQIEFISGGIVMNDEACTHYENIIDQMSYGLNILKDLFGTCGAVETGWQIDPFGHSKQYALILKEMGFKQLFFGRIDYQEKESRQNTTNMEFIWRLDELRNLTVSVLPDNYRAPPGFCFDIGCDDPVLVADESSEEYNLKNRADLFVDWVRNNSKSYRTNNLPVTMGEDFNYMEAHKWFSNMDLLIEYINSNKYTVEIDGDALEIQLMYSTPTCYSRASAEQEYSVNEADFFPYAYPDEHSYWTGYFTSRPSFKYLVRWANGVYRATTQILSEIGVKTSYLDSLKLALAISQHHDAITGTAKQFVNDNYVKHLSAGVQDAIKTLSGAFGKTISFCPLLNVSRCPQTEDLPAEGLSAVVYNSLAFNTSVFVRLPVRDANVEVRDEKGEVIEAPVTTISDAVFGLTERKSTSRYEVTIPLTINALSSRQLKISPKRGRRSLGISAEKVRGETVLTAGDVEVGIGHGGLQWIRAHGRLTKIQQSFGYYRSVCSKDSRSSGAYVFRPDGPKVALVLKDQKQINTDEFVEVRQTFSDNVAQNTRIYNSWISNDGIVVESDWIIGPINVSDNIGKEFVMTIHSDIYSNDTFFTDSNGRDTIRRVRNSRENWNLNLSEPVSGNYYPILSRISINDDDSHMTILTDRAQGATSLQSGSIEVMLHRRCLCDDHFGVDEALNEPGFDGKGLQVRGTFRVAFGKTPVSRKDELRMTPPFVFFTDENPTGVGFLDLGSNEGKLHIVTFTNVDDRHYLLRLENISEEPVTVDFATFLTQRYQSIQEMDLAGLSVISSLEEDRIEIESNNIKTFFIEV